MRKYWLVLAVLACASSPAAAVTVSDLYVATVPVKNESASARADGIRRALAQVMVRVSGDPRVAKFAESESILDQGRSLLQRYGYQRSGKSNLLLRAVFEGPALETAMLDAGLPVWGQSRPVTMVWLLVDGDLATRSGPQGVVQAMKAKASRRGIPLRLPPASAATGGRVSPAAIRNGNLSRLTEASRHYGTSHILVGQVADGAATWTLAADGAILQRWRTHGDQAASMVAAAVAHTATVYASRYAAVGTDNGTVIVGVQGVGGGRGYTRVRDFLSGLTAVEAVTPVLVDGKTVVFRITGPGDAEALDHRISVAGWLEDDKAARKFATQYAGGLPALGYSISQ